MIPKVKICGLTRECDIDYVNEARPDYIGFVFAPSRRQIRIPDAEVLRKKVAEGIQTVGVFVDEEPEEIIALINNGIIDIAQLHGSEPASCVSSLKERTGCRIIKAIHPGSGNHGVDIYEDYIGAGTDFFLFDSGGTTQAGGTGKTFNWDLIPEIDCPYFLAGGLSLENIREALDHTAPYGVDISSGVETDGVKDRDKILKIIRRIRNV